LLNRLVDPVVVTCSQTFLQSFRNSDLHPSAPILSKSLSRSICTIIGFQISSCAQIVNLDLVVFPEHVIPNLAPLHFVPDTSSLTLDYQVWSYEPTELPEKFEHFGNVGFRMWKLSIRCSATVSSLAIWSIWVFVVHVLLVEQAYECVTYKNSNFSDGGLDTQHSEWFRWS
jgi:hypothetical protein